MRAASATVNDFNGAINFSITFGRNINIIAGENGTGKTRLLQALKTGGDTVESYDSASYDVRKVFAINPKRNSEMREITQIIQMMKRENKSYSSLSDEAIGKHFNNGGFHNYPSFGELFLLYFDKLDRAGGDRNESMNSVVKEFNSVIESVFVEYEISARWDPIQGLPAPTIKKRGMEVPITGLSCGEAEVFSLALNLHALREQFDIFLIDEPETHLNWHLEKLLFLYLKKFSMDYDKQLIIATHSRVVVDPEFRDYSQFLFWDAGKVAVSSQLPREQRDKLLEDAYESLKIGGFSELTIFCEDESHCAYFEALLHSFGIENGRVARCGDSANVKSLYRTSIADGGWSNSIFVIDGDGQGTWKEAGDRFFQLEKYCVENYGLNLSVLTQIVNKCGAEIKQKLIDLLKGKRNRLFGKSKSLNFLIDLIKEDDITQDRIDQLDASEFFLPFIDWIGYESPRLFWDMIFNVCKDADNSVDYDKFVDADLLRYIKEWASIALSANDIPSPVEP